MPVIAVVPLSRTMYSPSRLFHTAFSRPVSPEWANVESPMTAAIRPFWCGGATMSMPCAMVSEAPMSSSVSIASYGGSTPRE